MTRLLVGTRGSDLALWQTRWVCARLRQLHPTLEIEEIIIMTEGDVVGNRPDDAWPVGAFVHAIEQALLEKRIDFAVHSFKDLQTAPTPCLTIAAVPRREAVHDVLLTKTAVDLDRLPAGFRIGTGSPRRAAQLRRLGSVQIVPIRGNVPTRVKKLDREELDGIVLAAAGLHRLEIKHPLAIDLPLDRFLPAPAQGALAVQSRVGEVVVEMLKPIDEPNVRAAVTAERSFLNGVGAGCHTPAAALATVAGVIEPGDSPNIKLCAQLFSDDELRFAEGSITGTEPEALGMVLAEQLRKEMGE